MWDDHDYGLNDAGAEFMGKDESKRQFLTFFGEPSGSPRWQRPGVYDAKIFGPPGKRVQVILLDGRYNRSPLKKGKRGSHPNYPFLEPYLPNTDADATMLEQLLVNLALIAGHAHPEVVRAISGPFRRLTRPLEQRTTCSAMTQLAKQVAVVTGAGANGGNGHAIALGLAGAGAKTGPPISSR